MSTTASYPDWYYRFSSAIVKTFNVVMTDQTEDVILAALSGDDGWWLVGSFSKLVELVLVDEGFHVTFDGESRVKYIVDQAHPTRGVMIAEDEMEPGTYMWVFFDHG